MTEGVRIPSAPAGLGRRGAAFWRSVWKGWEPNEAQRELLLETCRQLDILDELRAAIKSDGPTVEGSKGQPRANPLLQELSRSETSLVRLMAALNLEVDRDEQDDPRNVHVRSIESIKASRAAHSRWRRTGS